MPIPDSIKGYKPKGTEIQIHGGRYYVYKVKAVYDSQTKKSKRKSLGCIGQIIDGVGFVSNEKKDANCSVKEYGATALLLSCSENIMKNLTDIFGLEGLRIYVLSLLKLLSNSNQKNMEIAYRKSFISEKFSGIHISKNTLTDFMEKLGLERFKMLEFFKKVSSAEKQSIIFDGSSFCSNPKESQIRLIYGFDSTSSLPVYFNVVPGNISDKMAFVSSLKESGLKDCSVILDNGFYSAGNLGFMSDNNVNFIIPLSENMTVIKEFDVHVFDKIHNHFYYHKRTINYVWIKSDYLGKYNVYAYYDLERRRELLNNYYKKEGINTEEPSEEEKTQLDKDTKYFGMTFLVSSAQIEPEAAYRQYKKRWAIEEMFDKHKNTLHFDMSYETKVNSQFGWAFIEFVSLVIYLKTETNLNSCKETKNLSVHDAFLRFSSVVKCKIGDRWETWNLGKETKAQLEALGVNLSQ